MKPAGGGDQDERAKVRMACRARGRQAAQEEDKKARHTGLGGTEPSARTCDMAGTLAVAASLAAVVGKTLKTEFEKKLRR